MALVPCPDCGRLLSPVASFCPQCGRPATIGTATGRSTSMLRLALFLILAGSTAGLMWAVIARKGFWLPGLFFGVGFSLSVRFRPHTLLSFASVSGIIYLIAYFTGQLTSIAFAHWGVISGLGYIPVWGVLSGAIGAFLLLQVIALFYDVRVPILDWSVILAGSVIGFAFLEAVARVAGFGKDTIEDTAVPMIGFAFWQATVGVLSYRAVGRATNEKRPSGAFSLWLQQVLTGPAVQFLGLVATLLSLFQILWNLE